MQILIATSNVHKLKEITALLPAKMQTGEPFEYISLTDILRLSLPPETGTTLEQNAIAKACYAARLAGMWALSDDTGLEVDFLQGRPGVHTARYAGEHADAAANNQKLLQELTKALPPQRTARFRTVACLADPLGNTTCFEGILEGSITSQYRGEHGFGYDPIFVVKTTGQTLAEMTTAEKNKISHRAYAFKQAADYLYRLKK